MEITFGMFLDGSDWPPSKRASLHTMVCGPLSLLKVLEERLGLSGVEPEEPDRINAYMQKIQAVDLDWCRDSFALDPWSTAMQLLAWRDELIEAGWDGRCDGGSERLKALALLEQTEGLLSLSPGDRMWRVLAALGSVPCRDLLHLVEPRQILPWVWREIILRLEQNGATVKEPMAEVSDAGMVEIIPISGRDEVTLAVHLARYLRCGANDKLAVICESDSGLLDGVLHRYGFGALGVQHPSRWRESLQILPLFLETVWSPFNPQRFLELLQLPASPISKVIARPLSAALQKEPGIGGEAWQEAWAKAEKTITENAQGYDDDIPKALRKLQTLRTLIEKESFQADKEVAVEILRARCAHLAQSLGPKVKETPALGKVIVQITALQALLVGRQTIGRTELLRMLDSVIGNGTTDSNVCREVNAFQVVKHPGKLVEDYDTVIWWNFIDPGMSKQTRWTEEELSVLRENDRQFYRLREELAWSQALRHAKKRLIVFIPAQVAGEAVFVHPWRSKFSEIKDIPADGLIKELGRWCLAERETLLQEEASAAILVPEIELMPAEIKPLRRLSYSQMSTLLSCPFQWFLNDYVGLSTPPALDIPHESAMIGTLAHKVVELLFKESKTWTPEAAEVRAGELFDDLVGKMAAELLMPGRGVVKDRYRETLRLAIKALIAEIKNRQLTIVDTEREIEIEAGSDAPFAGVGFFGAIDMLLKDATGMPVVIDLKWSSKTFYESLVKDKKALQLATYAWLLRSDDLAVPCSYFLFPSQLFLDGAVQDWKKLWEDALKTLKMRLETLRTGKLERGIASVKKPKESKKADGLSESDLALSESGLELVLAASCKFCHYTAICNGGGESHE